MCKALWVGRVPILQTTIELNPRAQRSCLCGTPVGGQSSCCFCQVAPHISSTLTASPELCALDQLYYLTVLYTSSSKSRQRMHNSINCLFWPHHSPSISQKLFIHCAPETLGQSPVLSLNLSIYSESPQHILNLTETWLPLRTLIPFQASWAVTVCLPLLMCIWALDLKRVPLLFFITSRTLSLPSTLKLSVLSHFIRHFASHRPHAQITSH